MRYILPLYVLILCLILGIAFLLSGCSVQKQYQRELTKTKLFLLNNPNVEAALCARDFPIRTDSSKKGAVITKTDTLITVSYIVKKDTVVKTVNRDIVRLQLRVDTLYREDVAKYDSIKNYADKLNTGLIRVQQQFLDKEVQVKEAQSETNKWKLRAWVTWGIIALALGLKLYFTFFGGGYLSSLFSAFKK